ncbi:hypothetical protein [Spirillospora sp. NPDC029432]|uniref:hypothetical protein n=1 Tax=Spirillospora sp. NPDC029432 TaxID=3154599 RepID=UPI003451A08A
MPYWENGRLHGAAAPEQDHDQSAGEPPPAASGTEALAAVVRRPCARCGEIRCAWRNAVAEAGGEPVSHYFGTCPRCAATRTRAFRLPTAG